MGALLLAAGVLVVLSTLFLGRPHSSEPPAAPALPSVASLPGSDPHAAILVDSPIVIDRHAERWPCAVCGSAVHCEPHRVEHIAEQRYRVARPRCPRCGFERDIYFLLRP